MLDVSKSHEDPRQLVMSAVLALHLIVDSTGVIPTANSLWVRKGPNLRHWVLVFFLLFGRLDV